MMFHPVRTVIIGILLTIVGSFLGGLACERVQSHYGFSLALLTYLVVTPTLIISVTSVIRWLEPNEL